MTDKSKVYATRDSILGCQDISFEDVFIPEWNMTVRIRSMTGRERDRLESSLLEQRGKDQGVNLANVRAKIAVYSVVDENGQLIFSEKDVKPLSEKNAFALQRIMVVAQKLSGIGEEDIEDYVKDIEDNPFDPSATDSV